MKTKSIVIASTAAVFTFASCTKEKAPESKIASSSADYPLTTCVVSGEELGSMGEAVVYDHEGMTVKFCCKSCIPKFEKEPEKYLSKIQ